MPIEKSKLHLHPRNLHTGRYDFKKLIASSPELRSFVSPNLHRELSIDFSDPEAVRELNRALLKFFYKIKFWDIPEGYLCPPIPGRADYLHHVADLLASANGGVVPRGESVRVLDVGMGASCIYPVIGNREYGWRFVGSDVDPLALKSAQRIVKENPEFTDQIEIRKQAEAFHVLAGVIYPKEEFDLVVCNPPFHKSLREAQSASKRKWTNLGKEGARGERSKSSARNTLLNFGGKGSELWCPGGESAFIGQMIRESQAVRGRVMWFSTLVSKSEALPGIHRMLKRAKATEIRNLEMSQGHKISRVVAWTYLSAPEQAKWRAKHWSKASK